jgi:hypothetical protein
MSKTIIIHFTVTGRLGNPVEETYSTSYSARDEKEVVRTLINGREMYYGVPIIVHRIRKLEIIETDLSDILRGE